jgi:transposase
MRLAPYWMLQPKSILNWVRDFALANYEKPEPEGQVIVVAELDEMFPKEMLRDGILSSQKKTKYGSGKHMIVVAGDSSTGKMEIAMLKPLKSSSNA